MPAAFGDVLHYFQTEHGDYITVDEERCLIRLALQGNSGTYDAAVKWDDPVQRLIVRVVNIATVPEDKRAAACVLVNLVNWRLMIGNFELDMDDGELAFRTAFDVDDGTLGQKQINTHFMLSLQTVDRFNPAFQKFIWADASADEALAAVEL